MLVYQQADLSGERAEERGLRLFEGPPVVVVVVVLVVLVVMAEESEETAEDGGHCFESRIGWMTD